MDGKNYKGWNKIHTGGQYTYEFSTQAGGLISADMLGFSVGSITVTCSSDYVGSGTLNILQGNTKSNGFPTTAGPIVLAANANEGRFDIPITGRYLIIKRQAEFKITSGSATIIITGKR